MARLVFISPGFENQSCELAEGRTTVGRGPANGLLIQDNSISTDHAEILLNGDEFIVREHGSSNGTWVAGKRISGQAPVNNGQVIRFGAVEARLEMPMPAPVPDQTEMTAVHLHAVAMREQWRSPAGSSQIVIKPRGTYEPVDETVAIPGAAEPPENRPASAATPAREASGMWLRVLVAGALVVVAGLVAWWFFWR